MRTASPTARSSPAVSRFAAGEEPAKGLDNTTHVEVARVRADGHVLRVPLRRRPEADGQRLHAHLGQRRAQSRSLFLDAQRLERRRQLHGRSTRERRRRSPAASRRGSTSSTTRRRTSTTSSTSRRGTASRAESAGGHPGGRDRTAVEWRRSISRPHINLNVGRRVERRPNQRLPADQVQRRRSRRRSRRCGSRCSTTTASSRI